MHVLLLSVRFVILDVDDYFDLMTFQMAWHIVLSTCDCDVHVQIMTCLD